MFYFNYRGVTRDFTEQTVYGMLSHSEDGEHTYINGREVSFTSVSTSTPFKLNGDRLYTGDILKVENRGIGVIIFSCKYGAYMFAFSNGDEDELLYDVLSDYKCKKISTTFELDRSASDV